MWLTALRLILKFLPTLIQPLAVLIGVSQITGALGIGITRVADSFTGTTGTGAGNAAASVASVVSTAQNAASSVTGGIIPPVNRPAVPEAVLPNVRPADSALDRFTNPWLYVGLAMLALFASAALRQTRGLARDVGSGVRSSHDAFNDLGSDPVSPKGRRR